MSQKFPEIKRSLIEERDEYISQRLRDHANRHIVAVLGAGHIPGVTKNFTRENSLDELKKIPPPTLLGRLFAWAIPLIVVTMMVIGFLKGTGGESYMTLAIWSLSTAIGASLGALIALAHPLSILAAFVSAPITTLHPFIASGMVSGLVEAMVQKPTVGDFESVIDDLGSIKGWYRNRITRILLTLILTNLFGTLGVIVGISWLASLTS